jgi:uncharacterized protein YodC (DUF2158 family)
MNNKPNKNSPPKPIAEGDVVAIKSGSGRMTVVKITDGRATVIWSDFDTKAIHTENLPLVALTRVQ